MVFVVRLAACLVSFWISYLSAGESMYKLAIVSMFKNTAPYMKEWIEYHRLVGVDHFWLYNDASSDHWDEVLQSYIEEGIVEVFDWPATKPWWVDDQVRAFQDGLSRALGKTDWVALIDQDEFLLPMQENSVVDCLNEHFSHASAVYVNWRCFGTSQVTLKENEPMLQRLISCAPKFHSSSGVGKSIVRPEHVLIDAVWYVHHCPLIDEAIFLNGDGSQTLKKITWDDWHTDAQLHDTFLRINHYTHRDEKYFWEIRYPKYPEQHVEIENYEIFNLDNDFTILDLINDVDEDFFNKLQN